MGEIAQFVAMPFDLIDTDLVPGDAFKCATPAAAIDRAKGYWKTFGHAGAVAFVQTGYPEPRITVLRTFGNVPNHWPA
jgi:hypothetical protein